MYNSQSLKWEVKRCFIVLILLRMLVVKRWFIVANLLNCGKLRDHV